MVERTIKEIENPEELLEMGLVAGIRNGKFENAIEFFQRAIELEPNNSRAWFLLGLAHDYQDNIDQAIDCYLKAIELYPDYLEALVNLGTDYTKIGDLDKAVACFTEALDIKPDYIEAMVNLGQVYL
ncbi:MAG: tetratricopeptide repeat protein, partial [Candidatus Heimdallarchaeota archaeon]